MKHTNETGSTFFFCLFVVSHPLINIHTYKHFKKKQTNERTNGQKNIYIKSQLLEKKAPLLNHNDKCTKQ